MKVLLDESLSQRLCDPLVKAGHDAVHVGDLDLLSEPDEVIMQAARDSDRVLISADTDFGTLLAFSGDEWPSVLLLRGRGRTKPDRVSLIVEALTAAQAELEDGAIVVLDGNRLRIRVLPIRTAPPKDWR